MPPALTAPQKTVLRLLAQGYTQAEIAKRLKRSKATVRDHLEAARTKLGARNSHHAAQIAHELICSRSLGRLKDHPHAIDCWDDEAKT